METEIQVSMLRNDRIISIYLLATLKMLTFLENKHSVVFHLPFKNIKHLKRKAHTH